jgi:diguanylate cyclase (GGDEF)-like protein/PAS domain S-box-containing protein
LKYENRDAMFIRIIWRCDMALEKAKGESAEKNGSRPAEELRVPPRLREHFLFLEDLANNCGAIVFFRDAAGRLILVNEGFIRFINGDRNAVVGMMDSDILPPDILEAVRLRDDYVLKKKKSVHFEHEFEVSGEIRSFSCIKIPLQEEGAVYGTACIATDTTANKSEKASQRRWEEIFRNVRTGVAVLSPGKNTIQLANPAFARMHGYSTEELENRPVIDLFAADGLKLISQCLASATEKRSGSCETLHRKKDGTEFPVLVDIASVEAEPGKTQYWIINVQDLTALKQAEEKIKFQAYHDALTGLPNRELFLMYLDLEITQALRNNYKIAVLCLDIDRFKNVIDSLGHVAGNTILKETARRLRSCIRKSDTIARIGGDEFAILISDIKRPEDIVINVREIVAAMNAPFPVGNHEFYITLSFGISIFAEDGEDPETLLKNADNAMFHAKESGRNSYHFFNAALNKRTVERLLLENNLRKTMERDELLVYYQPQMNLATGVISSLEALVRWKHPELGLLKPEQFIPLAEEMGFINRIDEWVLRTACAQSKAWQEAGLRRLPVSVNLSAREFLDPELVPTISRILEETGLDPAYLEIELTESIAMRDTKLVADNLARLKEMGVGLAIDDFGTGFSSLSYLRKLPITKLKIDKSFVRGIASETGDQIIVSAVIAMGKSLGLHTVAEGVENKAQLAFLQSKQCDAVQGFLFNEPLPPRRFIDILSPEKGPKPNPG